MRIELTYECAECHRALVACELCGVLLHYAGELHIGLSYQVCGEGRRFRIGSLELHPALPRPRATCDILNKKPTRCIPVGVVGG